MYVCMYVMISPRRADGRGVKFENRSSASLFGRHGRFRDSEPGRSLNFSYTSQPRESLIDLVRVR